MKIMLWNVAMTPNPPPHINDRGAKERAPKIAAILNNFDVVVLNESFLSRDILTAHVIHPFIYTEPKIWYKIFNSGVVILSKVPLKNLNYKHYSRGAIWDWFVSKGLVGCSFDFAGTTFDLYGTHLQAGNYECTHEARQSQMEEIVSYLKDKHNPNHELIICGDFNCGPVYDPTFNQHSPHYSSADDARQRAAQYNTLVKGLNLKPLLMDPREDDICSFLLKQVSNKYVARRIKDPGNTHDLSDTGPLCIELLVSLSENKSPAI